MAAPPSLDHLYPSGAQRGTEPEVELVGKFDPWPPKLWTNSDSIDISPLEEKGKVKLAISENAAPGVYLVRCYNAEGASEPRFFTVTDEKEILEKEPNNNANETDTKLELPVIINGRLERRGDVDSFAIDLTKGQTLIADLQAYRLRSTVDALVQVITPNGIKKAVNHDHFQLDPFLTFHADESGKHVVQVMGFEYPAKADIRFGGGKNYIYRLSLSSGPYVATTLPMALQANVNHAMELNGWNLTTNQLSLTGSHPLASDSATHVHQVPGGNSVEIPVTLFPQLLEHKITNSLPFPSGLTGRLEHDQEVDRYTVQLEKDTRYTFSLETQAPIHHFDAWLAIEDADGKELKRDDDSRKHRDPELTWKATADGAFQIAVGNLLGTGDATFYYHLTSTKSQPRIAPTLSTSTLTYQPGSTNTITIDLNRKYGHQNPVRVSAKNVPVSITQTKGEASEKDNQAKLELIVSETAPPFMGEITFVAEDLETHHSQPVDVTFLGTTINNGVPAGFTELVLEKTESLWLTIPPQKDDPEEPEANP